MALTPPALTMATATSSSTASVSTTMRPPVRCRPAPCHPPLVSPLCPHHPLPHPLIPLCLRPDVLSSPIPLPPPSFHLLGFWGGFWGFWGWRGDAGLSPSPPLVTRRCPQGVSTCQGPSWWTWSQAPWTRCARDPSGRSSGRTTLFSVSPRVTLCSVGSPLSPCHVLLGDFGVPIVAGWQFPSFGGYEAPSGGPLWVMITMGWGVGSPPWWPMGALPSGMTHPSLVAFRCLSQWGGRSLLSHSW